MHVRTGTSKFLNDFTEKITGKSYNLRLCLVSRDVLLFDITIATLAMLPYHKCAQIMSHLQRKHFYFSVTLLLYIHVHVLYIYFNTNKEKLTSTHQNTYILFFAEMLKHRRVFLTRVPVQEVLCGLTFDALCGAAKAQAKSGEMVFLVWPLNFQQ